MQQQYHQAYPPKIGKIAKNYQKHGKPMMQSILKVRAIGSNEDVSDETTEMFAKLHHIERLHFECGLV